MANANLLDLIRRLIPEPSAPAGTHPGSAPADDSAQIPAGETIKLGPELIVTHDCYEIKGRRYPRASQIARANMNIDANHFRPAEADDFAQSVPRRHEIFAHLTAGMADMLERIAQIDNNPRLGSMILISGPTGCGKTTLAKTYCFAANLPITELNFSGDSTLTDFFHHKTPSNLRREYQKLTRFPGGYLVLGDAIASFNPFYAQAMASAALQAAVLDEVLTGRGPLDTLWKPFFKRTAKVVDLAWALAAGQDFNFPETRGRKTRGTNLKNAYMAKLQRATQRDTVVYGAFLRVANLLAPRKSLFQPPIMWRVLRGGK